MRKRIVSVLLLLAILGSLTVNALGSDYEITPYFNNTGATSTNFVISTTGKATVSAVYNAYREYFTHAKVTSYIEKRTLGIFWTRVDIGRPNDEWMDTSTEYADAFAHEFQLTKTGTYRATVVYEISGTGGETDVIDFEKTLTYS